MCRFDEAAWQRAMAAQAPFGSLNWADPQVQRLANMRAGQQLPHAGLSVQAKLQAREARELDLETYQALDFCLSQTLSKGHFCIN